MTILPKTFPVQRFIALVCEHVKDYSPTTQAIASKAFYEGKKLATAKERARMHVAKLKAKGMQQ